jgi:4-carboxymuconolactone decarboxylase
MTGTNPRVAPDLIREHAPKLADLTDDVLFADVWERPGLSPRDRSLITVAALVALGRDAQLIGHLRRALDNGLSRDQLAEAITHLAFYAGWPAAMSAVGVLASVTGPDGK